MEMAISMSSAGSAPPASEVMLVMPSKSTYESGTAGTL